MNERFHEPRVSSFDVNSQERELSNFIEEDSSKDRLARLIHEESSVVTQHFLGVDFLAISKNMEETLNKQKESNNFDDVKRERKKFNDETLELEITDPQMVDRKEIQCPEIQSMVQGLPELENQQQLHGVYIHLSLFQKELARLEKNDQNISLIVSQIENFSQTLALKRGDESFPQEKTSEELNLKAENLLKEDVGVACSEEGAFKSLHNQQDIRSVTLEKITHLAGALVRKFGSVNDNFEKEILKLRYFIQQLDACSAEKESKMSINNAEEFSFPEEERNQKDDEDDTKAARFSEILQENDRLLQQFEQYHRKNQSNHSQVKLINCKFKNLLSAHETSESNIAELEVFSQQLQSIRENQQALKSSVNDIAPSKGVIAEYVIKGFENITQNIVTMERITETLIKNIDDQINSSPSKISESSSNAMAKFKRGEKDTKKALNQKSSRAFKLSPGKENIGPGETLRNSDAAISQHRTLQDEIRLESQHVTEQNSKDEFLMSNVTYLPAQKLFRSSEFTEEIDRLEAELVEEFSKSKGPLLFWQVISCLKREAESEVLWENIPQKKETRVIDNIGLIILNKVKGLQETTQNELIKIHQKKQKNTTAFLLSAFKLLIKLVRLLLSDLGNTLHSNKT